MYVRFLLCITLLCMPCQSAAFFDALKSWWFGKAVERACQKQDFKRADALLTERQIHDPNDPVVDYNLGVVNHQEGRTAEAIHNFERAYARSEANPALHEAAALNAGTAYHTQTLAHLQHKKDEKALEKATHDISQAIHWYDRVLEHAPEHELAKLKKQHAEQLRDMLKQQQQQQQDQQNQDQQNQQNQEQNSSSQDQNQSSQQQKNKNSKSNEQDEQNSSSQQQDQENESSNADQQKSKKKSKRERKKEERERKKKAEQEAQKEQEQSSQEDGGEKGAEQDQQQAEQQHKEGDQKDDGERDQKGDQHDKEDAAKPDEQKTAAEQQAAGERGEEKKEEQKEGSSRGAQAGAAPEDGEQQEAMMATGPTETLEQKRLRALVETLEQQEGALQKSYLKQRTGQIAQPTAQGQKTW